MYIHGRHNQYHSCMDLSSVSKQKTYLRPLFNETKNENLHHGRDDECSALTIYIF